MVCSGSKPAFRNWAPAFAGVVVMVGENENLATSHYTADMRFLPLALLIAAPAMAVTPAHTGVPKIRTGPELSDIALFVMAALGVWFVRRAMRARFAKRPKPGNTKD